MAQALDVLAAKAPHVLVIDDDPIFREVAVAALEAAGLRPLQAADGEAAWSMLAGRGPRVVLLDLEMPNLDGFQILDSLAAQRRKSRLPVIVVTSRTDQAALEQAYALGATAVLTKPLDWPAAIAHVEVILARETATVRLRAARRLAEMTRRLQPQPRAAGKADKLVSLHSLLAMVQIQIAGVARSRHVPVGIIWPTAPVMLACDPDRLAGAIGRLAAHVVGHAPPGNTVLVQAQEDGGELLGLEIVDVGLPEPADRIGDGRAANARQHERSLLAQAAEELAAQGVRVEILHGAQGRSAIVLAVSLSTHDAGATQAA